MIDTHQHLIYRDHLGYAWTHNIAALAKGDFTLGDYYGLAGDQVTAQLYMECGVDDGDYQTEARFIADLMQHDSRLLGQIASCRPETDTGFDAWLDQASDLGVVGYRRILHVMPDDLSQSPVFRANLAKIGARSLPFDLCLRADQLTIGLGLVRACDDQSFVLDHCGVPDIAAGAFDDWADQIRHIADLDHMNCKLSGIAAYCGDRQPDYGTLRPWVDHILECFGPKRIVWGSDWPVVNLGAGLSDWLGVTRKILDNLSRDEAEHITHKNAQRIYGILL
jgi:predicted TIM-barrel fold metal-dependent hydrolase